MGTKSCVIITMVDMYSLEKIVSNYVSCWKQHRPAYTGLFENNDFGCEHLQVFRNGFDITDFSHDELSQLVIFLTRELRGQINNDHYQLWSWCASLTLYFKKNVLLFADKDWTHCCRDLVNLLLTNSTGSLANQDKLGYVNFHTIMTSLNKWNISGPLAFSTLEGLLRRKNNNYVDTSGKVIQPFKILNSKGQTVHFNQKTRNERLNRINGSLYCLEQNTIPSRGRTCPYLNQFKSEFLQLYPLVGSVYDTIDEWRNNLVHGNEYWQNRTPIITNLICLLIVDEIDPATYEANKAKLKRDVEWNIQSTEMSGIRTPWHLYPPDT